MKAKQQKKRLYARLENLFVTAGMALIAIGCAANLYGAYVSRSFIHDPLDASFYLRYIILLGGGFAAGYLLAGKAVRRTMSGRLFLGIAHAMLAVSLFWLLDLARLGIQNLGATPSYPLGKIAFMGVPLLAAAIVFAFAYFSQHRPNRPGVSVLTKATIIASFAAYEVYVLVSGAYAVITGGATFGPDASAWSIISSYLTTPLVIAALSYLLLSGVRKRRSRLFYAVMTGMFYSIFTLVLWEFQTAASYDAAKAFGTATTALALLSTGALLWQARRTLA